MESDFKTLLETYFGSPSLFGDRIYPVILPQGVVRPALTYQVISGPREYTQDGPDGVTTFRIQCDVYASTYSEVVAAKQAFETAVNAFLADVIDGARVIIGSTRFHGAFIDNERDEYESELDDAGPRLWRKSLDTLVTASAV